MSIQRYMGIAVGIGLGVSMEPSDDGYWVSYSDHVAAVEEIKQAALESAPSQVRQDEIRRLYNIGYSDGVARERYRIRQAARALATERELNSPSDIPVDLWEILSIIDGGDTE